jgi:hypothetical protein
MNDQVDIGDDYDWVDIELNSVKELIHWKDFGDKQFRGKYIKIRFLQITDKSKQK